MIITRPFDINSIEDYQFTTKYHAAVVINCEMLLLLSGNW